MNPDESKTCGFIIEDPTFNRYLRLGSRPKEYAWVNSAHDSSIFESWEKAKELWDFFKLSGLCLLLKVDLKDGKIVGPIRGYEPVSFYNLPKPEEPRKSNLKAQIRGLELAQLRRDVSAILRRIEGIIERDLEAD